MFWKKPSHISTPVESGHNHLNLQDKKQKSIDDCKKRSWLNIKTFRKSKIINLSDEIQCNKDFACKKTTSGIENIDEEEIFELACECFDDRSVINQDDHKVEDILAYQDDTLLPEELCDLPTFLGTQNCDSKLIEETRKLLRNSYRKNPNYFYKHDYERMLCDDWSVTRFLLRCRQNPARSADLMEKCSKFRKLYKMSELKLDDFPLEFLELSALFHYEPDRVGNITVYMRCGLYKRIPELNELFKAFTLCLLEEADCISKGRGMAIILDLTGCSFEHFDLDYLSWLVSAFRYHCPKGVSYIVVYNLPWFLKATCKLVISWLSSTNKRALRFASGKEIEFFVKPENLPEYLGGKCKRLCGSEFKNWKKLHDCVAWLALRHLKRRKFNIGPIIIDN